MVPSRIVTSKTIAGNPTIHTLKVTEIKKVEEKKIRKLVISTDGLVGPTGNGSKVIMLIGETGSGKTLMINALLNYILGVKWEDSYRYKLDPDESEKKKRGHSQSQTEWISAYTLYYHESLTIHHSITIIDTPGFGDTDGISKDRKLSDQMNAFFSGNSDEGIDQIDAVIFVVQSDKPRLTTSQRYVFDCVLSLFGKDIKENIFLFTTFADQNEPLVLEGMKESRFPYLAYYKFNNSHLYAQKESASASKEDSSDDEREMYNKMFWKSGAKQCEKFFIELEKTSSKSTRLSFEVLRERKALNVRIKAIPQLIRSNLVILDRLSKEKEMLKASQDEMNKHSDYKYTVKEEVTQKKTLINGAYAMTCRNCKFNCHYPCSPYFKNLCLAFYWFRGCSVCPKKCLKSDHDNENFIYDTKVTSKEQTSTDVKARYDNAHKRSMSHKELVEKVSEEAASIRSKVKEHVRVARKIFDRLGKIALQKNPTSTADYLQYLIKAEIARKEVGWQERVIQLEEMIDEAQVQGDLAEGVEDLKLDGFASEAVL